MGGCVVELLLVVDGRRRAVVGVGVLLLLMLLLLLLLLQLLLLILMVEIAGVAVVREAWRFTAVAARSWPTTLLLL